MKKFLVVYAHPEPKSFCGAIKNVTVNKLKKIGHEVAVSDLYAMKFDPVASKESFLSVKNKDCFNFIAEQVSSYQHHYNSYPKEILTELDKIKWADNFIFIFPLWWGSYPAIMKGWMDRCLLYGHSWTKDDHYDRGYLKGKKAMAAVSCGAAEHDFKTEGHQRMTVDDLLLHFNHSSMGFVNVTALKSYPFYRIGAIDEAERKKKLEEYEKALEDFDNRETVFPNKH